MAIYVMHIQVVDERWIGGGGVAMEAKQESSPVWSSAPNNDSGNTPQVQPNMAL